MKKLSNKVKIQINGLNTLRFIYLLKSNNIQLYNIEHKENVTYAVLYVSDFKKIRKYVRLARVRIKVLRRYGPLFFINKNKTRYFFIIGLFIFIFINLVSNKKIISINITGNNYYSQKEIYEFLKENNIDYGIKSKKISCTQLEQTLLDNFPLLTFVSVYIDGNTLKIAIKENDTGTVDLSKQEPCSLTATKDGEIISILTRSGTPLVRTGDIVKAGDILVSSKIDYTNPFDEILGYETVSADADILIKTINDYKEVVNRKYEIKKYTGRTMLITGVKLHNMYICLTKEKCPYTHYDVETEYKTENYGYKSIPVTYYYETYREYEPIECEYTDEELTAKSNDILEKYIEKLQENSIQIIEKSVNIDLYGESAVLSGKIITVEPAYTKVKYINEDT